MKRKFKDALRLQLVRLNDLMASNIAAIDNLRFSIEGMMKKYEELFVASLPEGRKYPKEGGK